MDGLLHSVTGYLLGNFYDIGGNEGNVEREELGIEIEEVIMRVGRYWEGMYGFLWRFWWRVRVD